MPGPEGICRDYLELIKEMKSTHDRETIHHLDLWRQVAMIRFPDILSLIALPFLMLRRLQSGILSKYRSQIVFTSERS